MSIWTHCQQCGTPWKEHTTACRPGVIRKRGPFPTGDEPLKALPCATCASLEAEVARLRALLADARHPWLNSETRAAIDAALQESQPGGGP